MNVFIIVTALASAYNEPSVAGSSLNLQSDAFVRHGMWQTRVECEKALTESVLSRDRNWVVKKSNIGVIGELRMTGANTETLERMSCQAIVIKK